MKKISILLGLIGALTACDPAKLSPMQGPINQTENSSAASGVDQRLAEPKTALVNGVKSPITNYLISKNHSGKYDIAFQYKGKQAETVTGISLKEATFINNLLRLERPTDYDFNLKLISGALDNDLDVNTNAPNLFEWLKANPKVMNSIVWEESTGARPWSTWSFLDQVQLWIAYQLAWKGGSVDVPSVPVNLETMADDKLAVTVLSANDTWAYYRASVAHSLVLEIGKRVNWTVMNYPSEQLAQLFDSREMYTWNTSPAGYSPKEGIIIPAPPQYSYQFMKNNNLIANNRLATICRSVDWCRYNLSHFLGWFYAGNTEAHWQYRGFPPMTRVLEGTLNANEPQWGIKHWTGGCAGTAGLFRALLRTVNIPVKRVIGGGHAQVWFMSEGYYLDHGDTPYDLMMRDPIIGASDLLINQAKFDTWFGPAVSEEDKEKNVGRLSFELTLKYLPKPLLGKYCLDKLNNRTHAQSDVFKVFEGRYTVFQLELMGLWNRMDAKIASLGGCGNIPPLY
jgi:hypothetical protein